MAVIHLILIVAAALFGRNADACYQHCSATFNHRIQRMQGIKDTNLLTQLSCSAMSEQLTCLEGQRSKCDVTSVQHVNSILNFMRPDYERTCASFINASTDGARTPTGLLEEQCQLKVGVCFHPFNSTFHAAFLASSVDWPTACDSLDNYTLCVEDLMPECGQHLGQYIRYIRRMQQHFSSNCSDSSSPLAHTECVNDTLDCYEEFNVIFLPASKEYLLDKMCGAMDMYTGCLHRVHERKECQRFTQHALNSLVSYKSKYAIYCGTDGGRQAGVCMNTFQQCYSKFNTTYFPAVHVGSMQGICSSVARYWQCVQPLYEQCGLKMSKSLSSVRILKEQFSMQCDPEFQRLSSCRPLAVCLKQFSEGLSTEPTSSASSTFCSSLTAYFPCVEESLAECNIPPEDTTVDFSRLGSLLGAYCQHLLGNSVLKSCQAFTSCAGGIVLVSTPDPSAMFDADTWCSFMDMSLSCVQRAINTPSCGLEQDDTVQGHLKQQRDLKRSICKLASVPPIPEDNHVGSGDHSHAHGHKGSDATVTRAGMTSLASLIVVSLVLQELL
ncbi:uncharacterized protein LOC143286588 [Babylonia areolata]|uniref:uncharacterized protein LOC143286588 n=1 Tax=Babylonia areolata TaxID=304850 RepID=UPI003FD4F36B